ncbi:rod shape-determining protein MreD [Aggregatilineales bacterium SYSU G02658]
MVRSALLLLLLIVLVALQSSVFPYIRFFSGQPNLILLVVVAWALDADWREAFTWAFVGGLLQDLMSIAPLGTSILPLVLAIFALKLLDQQFEGLSILLYFVVVVAASLLAQVVLFVGLGLVGYPIDLIPTIRYFLLPTMAYQIALALPVYLLVRWLHQLTRPRRSYGLSP